MDYWCTLLSRSQQLFGALVGCFFATMIIGSPAPTQAERFFKQSSPWHQKIPSNPTLKNGSKNYVDYLRSNSGVFNFSRKEWSIPIWRETASTPRYDIKVLDSSWRVQQGIDLNGWALNVPLPVEAKQGHRVAY